MIPTLDNTTIQAGPGKVIKAREGTSFELNDFDEVNAEDTETIFSALASIRWDTFIKATEGSTLESSVTAADFEAIVDTGECAVEVQSEGDDSIGPDHAKPVLRVQTVHATRVPVVHPGGPSTLPDIDSRFLNYRSSPLDAPSPSNVSSPAPSLFSDLTASSPISPSPPLGETTTSSVSPSPTRNQTRRGRIAGDKPYIPRPRNSFLLFREEFHRTQATRDLQRAQPHLSKIAGERWKAMSLAERRPYEEMAKKEKEEHSKRYPGYVYSPSSPKKRRAKATASETKTRIRAPNSLPQGSLHTWDSRRLSADTKVLHEPPEPVASSTEWNVFTPFGVATHSDEPQPAIPAPPDFHLDPLPLSLPPPFEFGVSCESHRPAPPSTATYPYARVLHNDLPQLTSAYLQPEVNTYLRPQFMPSDYTGTQYINPQLQAQVIGGSVYMPSPNLANHNGYPTNFNHPHSNNISVPLRPQHFDSFNYAGGPAHGVIPNGLWYANNEDVPMSSLLKSTTPVWRGGLQQSFPF